MPTCKKCGKEKTIRGFTQLRCNEYSERCLVCQAAEEAETLEAERAARRAEREKAKEEERKIQRDMVRLEKHNIRTKAAQRRAKERKRKAALAADSEKQRELARRVLARRRLLHFTERFHPDYRAGWVHKDVCRRLEQFLKDVEDQKSPRLMLFMPPRHGKSELASINFPSFALGHHPEYEIIASSYAVSLPIKFSKRVRGIIEDPAYQALFPDTRLDPKSTAVEDWLTTSGGGYVAAGVGGGITGKGAHIFVIDDPVKDAEEADSENQREKVWDWYGSTANTRVAPGGGMLVIQTRWHDDDLSGRLILQMQTSRKEIGETLTILRADLAAAEKRGADAEELAGIQTAIEDNEAELSSIDAWEIISYPAIATEHEWLGEGGEKLSDDEFRVLMAEEEYEAELARCRGAGSLVSGGEGTPLIRAEGEALHPQRLTLSMMRNKRRTLQPRHWSAMYQQNPVPDEGIYFTKSMIRLNPSPPIRRDMHLYGAWDLAIGERQTNDFTVGVIGGLDWDDQLHVLDVIRGRWGDPATISKAILDAHVKYGLQVTGLERGQLYLSVMPQIIKDMRRRRIAATFDDSLVPITDKAVRARPLQGRMQQGMVDFWSTQAWMEEVQYELLRFPGGVHDDIVDALAWLVRMVMKQSPPKRPKSQRRKSWRDKLRGHTAGGTKHPMAA